MIRFIYRCFAPLLALVKVITHSGQPSKGSMASRAKFRVAVAPLARDGFTPSGGCCTDFK